jgi:hypothetical protein
MNSENLPPEQLPAPLRPNKPVKRPKSETEAESPTVEGSPKPEGVAKPRPSKPVKPKDYPPPLPMFELSGNMPIPMASEPLQYRAIGLVKGAYLASAEEFTKGSVITDDGTLIDAVLLGRIMSLAKKHLDLAESHLWVVYPRVRKDDGKLHVQIMGIWEPKLIEPVDGVPVPTEPMEIPDNYFSVRGEVVFQSREKKEVFVKIRQAARKKDTEPRQFKLRLIGDFAEKMVGNFWEFDVLRQGDDLVIRTGQMIAALRPKGVKGKPPGGGDKKHFGKPWEHKAPSTSSSGEPLGKPVIKAKKIDEATEE